MIKVKNLTKIYRVPKSSKDGERKTLREFFRPKYEELLGVQDVSFNIGPGEIVGFVGLNGAGKTTTIKMLSGILTPSSGEINVGGYIPHRNRKKYAMEIAVIMGQKSILFYDIPVIESFKFYRDVYSLSTKEYNERLNLLKSALELDELLRIPVRKLSLGQRMRCEIAASILHNPKILFLDEPTIGLDILAKQKIMDFFTYLNKELQTTIFFTTHDVEDIDRICQRIMIIDDGKILFDGGINKINNRDKYKVIEILHIDGFHNDLLPSNLEKKILSIDNNKTAIQVATQDVSSIIDVLLDDPQVIDLNINAISLEQILQDIYTNKEGAELL